MTRLKFFIFLFILLGFMSACGLQDEFMKLEEAAKKVAAEPSTVEEPEGTAITEPSGRVATEAAYVPLTQPTEKFVVTDEEAAEERSAPPERTVYLTASQSGFSPNLVELNRGDTVELILTSADADYGFVSGGLGLDTDIPARGTVSFKFTPRQSGSFVFFSDKYSGRGTGEMRGVFVVR